MEEVFSSGYANSYQFCKIFEIMCKKHLLRVKHISGFCKSKVTPYYKTGTDCNIINHHWNAIYVNSKWYFCDLTFGSGGI
jgi:transglutaminase/protease-like cytokinesis protein 3